ncbi:hypothetical protein [Nocardia brasiliensis]|uniref:hypothetical protein n=1 Tax=Nocardia brasiliensis TaxID=37326 RepID=UPI0036721B94
MVAIVAAASMAGTVLAGPASAGDETLVKCAKKASYAEFQDCVKNEAGVAEKNRAATAKAEKDCAAKGGEWIVSENVCDTSGGP